MLIRDHHTKSVCINNIKYMHHSPLNQTKVRLPKLLKPSFFSLMFLCDTTVRWTICPLDIRGPLHWLSPFTDTSTMHVGGADMSLSASVGAQVQNGLRKLTLGHWQHPQKLLSLQVVKKRFSKRNSKIWGPNPLTINIHTPLCTCKNDNHKHEQVREKKIHQVECSSWWNNIYSACVRSATAKCSVRCRKVHWCQTVLTWVVSPPTSDSNLKGVFRLPCWTPKPIITVFCEKLKANQGGGEEWLHLPISQSCSCPGVTAALLWRCVFSQTSCGIESSKRTFACEQ